VYGDSSCVRRNKYGEVWSSDLGDLDVKLYPQKRIFRKTIFRPLGLLRPQIFTRARKSPSFTGALPTEGGVPLKSFFKGQSKIGLKCNKGALITLELRGVAGRNFGT